MRKSSTALHRHRFEFMLGGLLVLLLVGPFLRDGAGSLIRAAFAATLGIALVTGFWTFTVSTARRRLGIGLGVSVGVLGWAGAHFDLLGLRVAALVGLMAFGAWATALTLREVLIGPKVDWNRLMGAVCAYLLIGILWAFGYLLIAIHDPASFRGISGTSFDALMPQLTYYSFVTLTTLGYGDISPAGSLPRTLAYLEAIVGQMYIAILIAGLLGVHVASRTQGGGTPSGD